MSTAAGSGPRPTRSLTITSGSHRAPARAMLKAVGFTDDDLRKPLVGVANTWIEIGPCNLHLRRLAVAVKDGVRAAGATPMEFNTVSVSDGITMGTEGMRMSLVSREVIADSIELVARANHFDALVILVGCDKTIPGAAMALARLDIPGLVLYGGSIAPGRWQGKDVTIQDVFEAVGAFDSGRLSQSEFAALENSACPGAGACGGQFTANTMATACEFLGLSPFGSASVPAMDADKDAVAREAGKLVVELLARDLRPRQILSASAFENAIAAVAATGGSTNAVLHLMAIAKEAGVALRLEDFDRISASVPLVADLKPGGRFVATDLHAAGGTLLVAQRLNEAGRLHTSPLTVSGRTIGDEAARAKESPGQEVVRPLDAPLQPSGGLAILTGNLAPSGCVVKATKTTPRHAPGPGAGLRPRGRCRGRPDPGRHPCWRRRRDPIRGTKGRTRHARDAGGDRRNHGRRAGRVGRAHHGRPFLGRDARTDGGPRRPGSRGRRSHRGCARRRHDRHRRGRARAPDRSVRRGIEGQARDVEAAGATLRDRRHGEVRAARVLRVSRGDNGVVVSYQLPATSESVPIPVDGI